MMLVFLTLMLIFLLNIQILLHSVPQRNEPLSPWINHQNSLMKNFNLGAAGSSSPNGNGIPPAVWLEFIARSEVVQFKKNEMAHKEDCVPKRAYFIHEGLMMSYLKKGDRSIVNWISNEFAFGLDIIMSAPVDEAGNVLIVLEDTLAIAELKEVQKSIF